MGMHREPEAGGFADARHQLANGRGGQGASPLGREHVGAGRLLLPLEPPEGLDLGPSKRMGGGEAALESNNVQQASREIHLLPTESHQLAYAEAVAAGQHKQRGVPVPISATPTSCRRELLDLVGCEVLARPDDFSYPS